MKTELKDFSTEEILIELIKREKTDNFIELKNKNVSSYTFKFYLKK
jgi:hypothetical protein